MEVTNYISKHNEIIFYFFGICIIFIGFIYALWLDIWFSLGWASILISIGIAFIAIGISRKSEQMTGTIIKSSLYDTIGIMEDRRLEIRKKLEIIKKKIETISGYKHNSPELNLDITDYRIYYSYSIWKFKTYIDRVMFYKEYLDERDEEKLIHFYDNLLQDLCQGKEAFKINLANNYINNLESIFDIVSKYKRYNKDTISDQFRRERILENLKFLKNLSNKIIYYTFCRIVS